MMTDAAGTRASLLSIQVAKPVAVTVSERDRDGAPVA